LCFLELTFLSELLKFGYEVDWLEILGLRGDFIDWLLFLLDGRNRNGWCRDVGL
jgi:hypothetical protein